MDQSASCVDDNVIVYSHISSAESTPSHESNSEFEFSMSSAPGDTYESADQLFFKGQLLPLLLPSRNQMVETLRSHGEENKAFDGSYNSSVISEFRQNRSRFSLCWPMQQAELLCCGSGREAQRSSSFWDSYDKLESTDSSCRDSNGSSSQDSCFSSKDMETSEKCEKGPQEVLATSNEKVEKTRSSWLKLAFHWRLPFRSKKDSKAKAQSKRELKTIPETPGAKTNLNVQNTLCDFLSTPPLCGDRSSRKNMVRPNFGIPQHTSPVSSFSERNYKTLSSEKTGKGEIQRPGDSWQRYLKPLKHLREKVSEKNSNRVTSDLNEQAWIGEYSNAVQPLNNFLARESPYAKQSSCTSFLPASLKMPLFTKRSSAPTSRISSSRSSPNHSGVLSRPLDYATMSDIHNAIQGAIAHCKQSQTTKHDTI